MSWIVTPAHLDALEIGAGILGTGGGGNPYLGRLIARRFVEDGAEIAIFDPDEVPDDAVVVSVGYDDVAYTPLPGSYANRGRVADVGGGV